LLTATKDPLRNHDRGFALAGMVTKAVLAEWSRPFSLLLL